MDICHRASRMEIAGRSAQTPMEINRPTSKMPQKGICFGAAGHQVFGGAVPPTAAGGLPIGAPPEGMTRVR